MEVDATTQANQLPDVVEVEYPAAGSDPSHVVGLEVTYQWTPPRCSHCKVYGHVLSHCMDRTKDDQVPATVTPSDTPGIPLGNSFTGLERNGEGGKGSEVLPMSGKDGDSVIILGGPSTSVPECTTSREVEMDLGRILPAMWPDVLPVFPTVLVQRLAGWAIYYFDKAWWPGSRVGVGFCKGSKWWGWDMVLMQLFGPNMTCCGPIWFAAALIWIGGALFWPGVAHTYPAAALALPYGTSIYPFGGCCLMWFGAAVYGPALGGWAAASAWPWVGRCWPVMALGVLVLLISLGWKVVLLGPVSGLDMGFFLPIFGLYLMGCPWYIGLSFVGWTLVHLHGFWVVFGFLDLWAFFLVWDMSGCRPKEFLYRLYGSSTNGLGVILLAFPGLSDKCYSGGGRNICYFFLLRAEWRGTGPGRSCPTWVGNKMGWDLVNIKGGWVCYVGTCWIHTDNVELWLAWLLTTLEKPDCMDNGTNNRIGRLLAWFAGINQLWVWLGGWRRGNHCVTGLTIPGQPYANFPIQHVRMFGMQPLDSAICTITWWLGSSLGLQQQGWVMTIIHVMFFEVKTCRMGNAQWTNLLLAWCIMGGWTCAECNSCTSLNGLTWIRAMGVGCLSSKLLIWVVSLLAHIYIKSGHSIRGFVQRMDLVTSWVKGWFVAVMLLGRVHYSSWIRGCWLETLNRGYMGKVLKHDQVGLSNGTAARREDLLICQGVEVRYLQGGGSLAYDFSHIQVEYYCGQPAASMTTCAADWVDNLVYLIALWRVYMFCRHMAMQMDIIGYGKILSTRVPYAILMGTSIALSCPTFGGLMDNGSVVYVHPITCGAAMFTCCGSMMMNGVNDVMDADNGFRGVAQTCGCHYYFYCFMVRMRSYGYMMMHGEMMLWMPTIDLVGLHKVVAAILFLWLRFAWMACWPKVYMWCDFVSTWWQIACGLICMSCMRVVNGKARNTTVQVQMAGKGKEKMGVTVGNRFDVLQDTCGLVGTQQAINSSNLAAPVVNEQGVPMEVGSICTTNMKEVIHVGRILPNSLDVRGATTVPRSKPISEYKKSLIMDYINIIAAVLEIIANAWTSDEWSFFKATCKNLDLDLEFLVVDDLSFMEDNLIELQNVPPISEGKKQAIAKALNSEAKGVKVKHMVAWSVGEWKYFIDHVNVLGLNRGCGGRREWYCSVLGWLYLGVNAFQDMAQLFPSTAYFWPAVAWCCLADGPCKILPYVPRPPRAGHLVSAEVRSPCYRLLKILGSDWANLHFWVNVWVLWAFEWWVWGRYSWNVGGLGSFWCLLGLPLYFVKF
ncbi:hypothetical protein E3N88_16660 [Mikania micrantha]|uniref:Uncharacterized protein n=1 Tax=Mikania micrantha TaxID=192012 RepID=A0A5N6NYX2_9ASTR|nr:hypothetical protein E3N88_16660 [Mikania micrantha]